MLLVLALVSLAFLASILFRFSREEMMVDRCLSGKHGSFDYSTMSCDLEENHPYVPYAVRHPRDELGAVVAFISSAAFLLGLWRVRNGGRTH